jgi:hypothetical protein
MGHLSGKFLFAAALSAGACIGWFIRFPPADSSSAASWAQAVGTVAAVIGAFGVARYQMQAERNRLARIAIADQARELLGLQQLAAELAQICVLSNFEKSNRVETTIYPDAAAEFRYIADMFAAFPTVAVTALGKMEEVLYLRRIAIGASRIFAGDPDLTGDAFVLKHRKVFEKYRGDSLRISIALAERIEEVAPGEFTSQIRRHL